MNITVIHGSMRHGNTYHCTQLLLEEIRAQQETHVTQFFLPQDMPDFCTGCFSCFLNGEETCPHYESVQPIVVAMEAADVVVLTSPVYGLDVSGQMKTLIDHLCYMWMPHRPNPHMFRKIGVVVTTTAGAGLPHTAKTLNNSLSYWGFLRLFTFKKAVGALRWEDVSSQKRAQIEQETKQLGQRVVKASRRAGQLRPRLFTRMFFNAMMQSMKNNVSNSKDRAHWQQHGWLSG
ncbi:MAG: flavodoxin family protein, partial [Acetanaerobacterium sp.]